jgi:hypothetical protein
MAYRALRQRCRVAMFEAGDMTERQVLFRMASRISGVPIKRRYCGAFEIPINIEKSLKEEDNKENNHYRYVAKETKIIENPLTWGEAYKVGQDYMNKFANNGKNFMLSCTPNNTLTISGIESSLEMWEREKGFVPDVIIIDYADLIVPESAYKDFRHQVNEIWMSLRKMSEERHCLVLTATQAKASAYGSRIMDMSHPSEDKRKNAHVTGMVALNQDADEKKDGRMRLNWTVLREGEFTVEKCVYVAGCLRIGRPFMCSCW